MKKIMLLIGIIAAISSAYETFDCRKIGEFIEPSIQRDDAIEYIRTHSNEFTCGLDYDAYTWLLAYKNSTSMYTLAAIHSRSSGDGSWSGITYWYRNQYDYEKYVASTSSPGYNRITESSGQFKKFLNDKKKLF